MKKMKIVMATDYPIGGEKIDGGVQAVSSYIVNGLKKIEEVDLSIITFRSNISEPEEAIEDGIRIHVLPRAKRGGNLTFYRSDFKSFMACVNQIKPDLIHAQDASVEGYLASKSGYPSMVTFHGMISEDAKYRATFKDRMRFRLISWIAERYCVKSPNPKILISPYVKRHYGDRLKGKCVHIPNPIKNKFYEVVRQEEPGRILYAGKLIRRKGITDLIQALGTLDKSLEFRLFLAGALNDEAYVNQIKLLIKQLKLEDRVEFLGLINETQILEEFSKASMLVLPSYQETAPMVIQQAMAAKVAVAATRICGVPDQLENGDCGLLFEAGDIEGCRQQIHKLITDQEFRNNLVERAYIKAKNTFYADKVVAETVDFYKSVLGWSP